MLGLWFRLFARNLWYCMSVLLIILAIYFAILLIKEARATRKRLIKRDIEMKIWKGNIILKNISDNLTIAPFNPAKPVLFLPEFYLITSIKESRGVFDILMDTTPHCNYKDIKLDPNMYDYILQLYGKYNIVIIATCENKHIDDLYAAFEDIYIWTRVHHIPITYLMNDPPKEKVTTPDGKEIKGAVSKNMIIGKKDPRTFSVYIYGEE